MSSHIYIQMTLDLTIAFNKIFVTVLIKILCKQCVLFFFNKVQIDFQNSVSSENKPETVTR